MESACLLNKQTLRSEDEGFVYADRPKASCPDDHTSESSAIPSALVEIGKLLIFVIVG